MKCFAFLVQILRETNFEKFYWQLTRKNFPLYLASLLLLLFICLGETLAVDSQQRIPPAFPNGENETLSLPHAISNPLGEFHGDGKEGKVGPWKRLGWVCAFRRIWWTFSSEGRAVARNWPKNMILTSVVWLLGQDYPSSAIINFRTKCYTFFPPPPWLCAKMRIPLGDIHTHWLMSGSPLFFVMLIHTHSHRVRGMMEK